MKYQKDKFFGKFCSAHLGVNKVFVTAFPNEAAGVEGPCEVGQHYFKELRLLKSAFVLERLFFTHGSPLP